MKQFLRFSICLIGFFVHALSVMNAQTTADTITVNQSSSNNNLFDSEDVLQITLRGNIRALINDRSENSIYHPITLQYRTIGNQELSLTVAMKTRGHFRKMKENCAYPPLLIHFSKSDTLASSVFHDCNKLKLVMPCRGDEFVIHEWLAYKLYNLVTPESFKSRLVRVTLRDLKSGKDAAPFYAILLEEEEQMARQNNAINITRKLRPAQTDTTSFLNMAVFQYLIGNTDWSVEYLQNIKLIQHDSNARPITVPYDFDHAGIVKAPYALPAEELQMRSTLERRYRGYCINDMKAFDNTIAHYNRLKKDIYGIFSGCSLLDDRYIKFTEKFLDEFYSTINNPKAFQKDFGYPCNINGTGNVIIKGLRE